MNEIESAKEEGELSDDDERDPEPPPVSVSTVTAPTAPLPRGYRSFNDSQTTNTTEYKQPPFKFNRNRPRFRNRRRSDKRTFEYERNPLQNFSDFPNDLLYACAYAPPPPPPPLPDSPPPSSTPPPLPSSLPSTAKQFPIGIFFIQLDNILHTPGKLRHLDICKQ